MGKEIDRDSILADIDKDQEVILMKEIIFDINIQGQTLNNAKDQKITNNIKNINKAEARIIKNTSKAGIKTIKISHIIIEINILEEEVLLSIFSYKISESDDYYY